MRLEKIFRCQLAKFLVEGYPVRFRHQRYLRKFFAHKFHVIETFLCEERVAAGD